MLEPASVCVAPEHFCSDQHDDGTEQDLDAADIGAFEKEDAGNCSDYHQQCQRKTDFPANGFSFLPGEDKVGRVPAQQLNRGDAGIADAAYRYAMMVQRGNGVPKKPAEAAEYFKKAADKGIPEAAYEFAKMLQFCKAAQKMRKECERYYKMAADQGYAKAQFSYGLYLKNGDKVSDDS